MQGRAHPTAHTHAAALRTLVLARKKIWRPTLVWLRGNTPNHQVLQWQLHRSARLTPGGRVLTAGRAAQPRGAPAQGLLHAAFLLPTVHAAAPAELHPQAGLWPSCCACHIHIPCPQMKSKWDVSALEKAFPRDPVSRVSGDVAQLN